MGKDLSAAQKVGSPTLNALAPPCHYPFPIHVIAIDLSINKSDPKRVSGSHPDDGSILSSQDVIRRIFEAYDDDG